MNSAEALKALKLRESIPVYKMRRAYELGHALDEIRYDFRFILSMEEERFLYMLQDRLGYFENPNRQHTPPYKVD